MARWRVVRYFKIILPFNIPFPSQHFLFNQKKFFMHLHITELRLSFKFQKGVSDCSSSRFLNLGQLAGIINGFKVSKRVPLRTFTLLDCSEKAIT